MRGISQKVSIPFSYQEQTLEGSFRLKRLDYGVGKGTGGFMVGKEVDIRIRCVLE